MHSRRRLLLGAGTVAMATTAGCTGFVPGVGEEEAPNDGAACDEVTTVLAPPENGVPIENPPFPTHGDPVPGVSVPAPLHDREVDTAEFVCDRHQLYTFIFTRCHEACPGLTATLRQVQADSIEEGYEDEMAFLQFTFDPTHDTPEVIEEYEERYGVNPEPAHWYTLRPETEERAKVIVHETFGQEYTKLVDEEDDDEDSLDVEDLEGIGDEVGENDDMEMPFMHLSLILLANQAGYVERAYAYELPAPQDIIEDTRALIEAW